MKFLKSFVFLFTLLVPNVFSSEVKPPSPHVAPVIIVDNQVEKNKILLQLTHRVHVTFPPTKEERIKGAAEGGACGTAVGFKYINDPTSNHYLLTAAHLLYDTRETEDGIFLLYSKDIYIEMDEGWIRCTIEKIDVNFDLCILKTHANISLPKIIELGDKELKDGDEIINVGCPENVKPVLVNGKANSNHTGMIPGFWHGSSGSPVFFDNKLVGICIEGEVDPDTKDLRKGFAIFNNVEIIKAFLEEKKDK